MKKNLELRNMQMLLSNTQIKKQIFHDTNIFMLLMLPLLEKLKKQKLSFNLRLNLIQEIYYLIDLNEKIFLKSFSCKNENQVIAEILYIAANILSSQSIYPLSNFYLNLAKYLNEDFHSFDTLVAENFYKLDNFENAKKIYKGLSKRGDTFKWHSTKQLSRILVQEGKLSSGHARSLIGLSNSLEIAKKIIEKKLSVRQAEALTRKFRDKNIKLVSKKDSNVLELQRNLEEKTGLSVSINNKKNNSGTIYFEYNDLDQLDRLIETIKKYY